MSAFVLWVLQSGAQGQEWILLIFIFSGPSEEEGPEGSGGKTIDSVVRETWSPIPELLFPAVSVCAVVITGAVGQVFWSTHFGETK